MVQQVIDLDPSQPVRDAVESLHLPRRLILLIGEFDASLNDRVRSIFSRVIAPLALNPGALIVDDARPSGCALLMAQAAADQEAMPPRLGIVSHDRNPADIHPSHPVILRLHPSCSDVAKSTLRIADELADPGDPKPVVAVLVGGGDVEKRALIRCARHDWPVLVLTGSGWLADAIGAAKTPQADGNLPPLPRDPELREIVETARIFVQPLDGKVDDLERILLARLQTNSEALAPTLVQAWQRFDEIDSLANAMQRRFRRVELSLIFLAVTAALVAVLASSDAVPAATRAWVHRWYVPRGTLHILVVLTPIAISIVTAYNSHFRDGSKWVLLRGAAEALKREIFRYRAKAGVYRDERCQQKSAASRLAENIKDITTALEQSEVNKIDVTPVNIHEKSRLTFLAPGEYVESRIHDQLKFFQKKTRELSTQQRWIQTLIYMSGGAGTFLAALHRDVWVAFTSALATALATKLQSDSVENSLIQYKQARTSLRNVELWWTALSPWEKDRRHNIDLLVEQTEHTLEAETAGWVQKMQSALDKLTEKDTSPKRA